MGYTLTDAVAQHQRHPDTFEIPDQQEVLALEPGDYVKLIFTPEVAAEDSYGSERMWVMVTRNNGLDGAWAGVLDNQPTIPTLGLKLGDAVTFAWNNVITVVHPPEGS